MIRKMIGYKSFLFNFYMVTCKNTGRKEVSDNAQVFYGIWAQYSSYCYLRINKYKVILIQAYFSRAQMDYPKNQLQKRLDHQRL